ncbi:MAG: trypsin-like peptidase domain-containing protein [Clostridiales bacterium]|nr:trypsin-like peptidase domain-containing protein [Clostridiales bacterium]
MSYMSGAKDLKEDIFEEEKEEDEIKLKSEKSIFKTIIISMLVSLLVSASVCGGFLLVVSYFNNGSIDSKSKEVFTTHKMVTIENKSDELVAEIAEKVSPSIVCIKETILTRDFLFGITEAKGHGSGIVFREDGYILTNNHVIESALESNTNNLAKGCKIEVILPSSSDNKTYEAKVIGRDSKTDLAVIKIEKTGLVAATFGNSDELRVGEIAVAIGNPYSIEFMGTVTSGIISGLNRTIQSEDGRQFKLIQTDAAINSGNSGGALVNSKGEVIGINTLKLVDSGIEGLSFAVPSNTAKEIADNLVEYKYVKGRPLLGITIDPRYTESLAKRYGMPAGVYVYSVDLLSAAYKAGVEVGDVITEFNGVAVKNINELNAQKEKYKAGDEVTLKIYKTKDGKAKTVRVKLGEDVGTSS